MNKECCNNNVLDMSCDITGGTAMLFCAHHDSDISDCRWSGSKAHQLKCDIRPMRPEGVIMYHQAMYASSCPLVPRRAQTLYPGLAVLADTINFCLQQA